MAFLRLPTCVKSWPHFLGIAPSGLRQGEKSGARKSTREPSLTNSAAGAPGALAPLWRRAVALFHHADRVARTTPPHVRHGAIKVGAALALVLVGCLAVRGALSQEMARERAYYLVKAAGGGFSDRELAALMEEAGPSALKIAAQHHPDRPYPGVWGRPAGWERLEVHAPPNLGLGHLSMAEARTINGVILASDEDTPPAEPFYLRASASERDEAIKCLTAAVYYEAALEPREGQEGVAQVVLNRVRHPGYPKSVCGVVFQGADRPGCQFSFACDGSMARPPAAWAWRNAKDVATKALNGYVRKDVGTATHYHTSYVMAGWTPTLLKVKQIGLHIFFRPLGSEGLPSAFQASYQGGEAKVSRVAMIGKAEAAVSAPPALLAVSNTGSSVAPASAVQGGRMVVMPSGTVYLGRDQLAQVAPMHAMIAMRAAAAKAAQQQAAPQPAPGPVWAQDVIPIEPDPPAAAKAAPAPTAAAAG
jgi:spore germination cell wall hydrolase CwlJ-like protein